jgi:hypothetical protein
MSKSIFAERDRAVEVGNLLRITQLRRALLVLAMLPCCVNFASGQAATWTQRNASGCIPSSQLAARPSPRYGHAMATYVGGVILFGGSSVTDPNTCSGTLTRLNDTWFWNGQNWTFVYSLATCQQPASIANNVCPPAREGATMAFDPARGELVLFGGYTPFFGPNFTPHYFNDTWVFSNFKWQRVIADGSNAAPPARAYASMATWRNPNSVNGTNPYFIELTGGTKDDQGDVWNDSWYWSGASRTWTLFSTGSAFLQRTHAGMAYHAGTAALILPEGLFGTNAFWVDSEQFNARGWSEAPGVPPFCGGSFFSCDGLYDYGIAEYPAGGSVVVFGGTIHISNTNSIKAETFSWTGSKWAIFLPFGSFPSARTLDRMAYDSAHGVIVLFGGLGSDTDFNDTWTWGPASGVCADNGSHDSGGLEGAVFLQTWDWGGV